MTVNYLLYDRPMKSFDSNPQTEIYKAKTCNNFHFPLPFQSSFQTFVAVYLQWNVTVHIISILK